MLEREGNGSFRRKRNARAGVHKEGGKKMSTRKPLFSPSCLLIMCTKITQLGMTSCQISLAAMHLFLAFFFLKQKIWSEGTCDKKKFKCGRPLKEESCNNRWLFCYIKSSIKLLCQLLKETCWSWQLAWIVCLRKIKTLCWIGSCGAYKRTLVKGERRPELWKSTRRLQSIILIKSKFLVDL